MSTSVEYEIIRTLADRTGGAVDVATLRANAVARAKRVRRRRRVGACLLAVALLAGAAGAVGSLRDGDPRERSAGRTDSVPPRLPALDVPGAAARPDTVATDPSVIHFDVDAAALGATELIWRSVWTQESVSIRTAAGGENYVHFAISRTDGPLRHGYPAQSGFPGPYRDPPLDTRLDPTRPYPFDGAGLEEVRVDGAPGPVRAYPAPVQGTLKRHLMLWTPAPGVSALVEMVTDRPQELVRVAKALRLDRSQRCVAPATVSGAPQDATYFECETSLLAPDAAGDVWNYSILTFSARGGNYLDVLFGDLAVPQPFAPNRSVNGRPARWHAPEKGNPEATKLDVPGEPGRHLVVSVRSWNFTEPEVTKVAETFRWVGDPRDPGTWPSRLVG